jgi:hypothetical protein
MMHLIIPDAHVDPDVSNERFEWLGNLIIDRLPDVIVQLGDFCDVKSLCSYDRGKRDFHGRSYERDINAANDAISILESKIKRYNDNARKSKKQQYRPRKIALFGNHDEARITRLLQLQPELEGTVSTNDFKWSGNGWETVPYEIPICINGIYYCHTFPTGVSGEPISGVNLAQTLIAKNCVSSTVGHSHILDIANRATPGGKRIWGLSAGCFFNHPMSYAKATQERFWWSGVVVKKNVREGDYSPEVITIEEMKETYK